MSDLSCRILQVVGEIRGGGVGAWLLNMLPQLHRQGFICDFLVYKPEPPDAKEQIEPVAKGINCFY
jgi:hypothetical protein